MTHPAYLLARLNAKTSRMDGTGGCPPELTQQDIAACLAFVPAGPGREIMCALWWQAGAKLTANELDVMLMDAQLSEWRERMDALVTAQLRVASARLAHDRLRAKAALEAAKAKMWPRLGEGSSYAVIRRAVLDEMEGVHLCPACRGRRFQFSPLGAVKECSACAGSGRRRASDRSRAEAIERDEATYRRAWKPVFEWTERFCWDAVDPAIEAMEKAAA